MRNAAALNTGAASGMRATFADPARLEPVKWLAVVSMFIDHIGGAFFPEQTWMRDVGRFALPAFLIAFGIGLASSRDPFEAGGRLLLPAFLAQCAWAVLDKPTHVFNVLFLCIVCAWLVDAWRTRSVLLGGLALLYAGAMVGTFGLESGVGGVLLVLGGYFAARGSPGVLVLAAVTWLVGAASPGFVLGFGFACLFPRLSIEWPRRPGLLSWVYAGHLGVLAFLAVAV